MENLSLRELPCYKQQRQAGHKEHPAQHGHGAIALHRAFEDHEIEGIAESRNESQTVAEEIVAPLLAGMPGDNHNESAYESHDNTRHLKHGGAFMLKQHSDNKHEDGREGHDYGNVDRIGIAERQVEKIHEEKKSAGASEEDSEIVVALDALGLHKHRSQPHQYAAAAEPEHGDINRRHPLGDKDFDNRDVDTEEYGGEEYKEIPFKEASELWALLR